MNWMSILWPMAIAACLTLAVIHLQISLRLRGRARAAHIFFTLSALGVAATGSIELKLLFTRELADYQHLMLWAQAPIWLMLVSMTGYTWTSFVRGNRWLAFGAVALITLSSAGHFIVPPEFRIRHAVDLRVVETFGGAVFTLPVLKNGLLTGCEVGAAVLLIAFVVHSSVRTWRGGDRRRAVLVGGGIVFFHLVSRGFALTVEAGVADTPFFFIFPFLAMLLAMGQELSADMLRAARLAEQLRESEHQIDLAARGNDGFLGAGSGEGFALGDGRCAGVVRRADEGGA